MATVESTIEPVEERWGSGEAEKLAERIAVLEETVRWQDTTIRTLNEKLSSIHVSRAWRIAMAFSRIARMLLPLGSYRRSAVFQVARSTVNSWKRLIGA